MDAILKYAVSVAITAFIYGIGPLIYLWTRKEKVSRKKVKKACILIEILVFVVVSAINLLMGLNEIGNAAAACIWGFIFYQIVWTKLDNKGMLDDSAQQAEAPKKSKMDAFMGVEDDDKM